MFVSKVPGVWQRCFAAVLWEIYALRDLQWSATSNWLWFDHRNVPVQVKSGGVWKLPLLHYHTKISTQRGDLYSARHNLCHVQGSLRDCMCHLLLEVSVLLPSFWWCTCLLHLKSSPLSSLWEHELLFYILWPLNKSLSCLYQTQFCNWQRECEQEGIPWPRQGTSVQIGPQEEDLTSNVIAGVLIVKHEFLCQALLKVRSAKRSGHKRTPFKPLY